MPEPEEKVPGTIESPASKPTRYQTTEYNRLVRLRNKVKDLFGRARSFRWTLKEYLSHRTTDLYESPDWLRATHATRQYVQGWEDCLWEQLYMTHLEFRHLLDDKWLLPDEVKVALGEDRSWREVKGVRFFWKPREGDTRLYPWTE